MYTTNMTMLQPEAFVTVKKNRLKLYENKNHYLKSKTNLQSFSDNLTDLDLHFLYQQNLDSNLNTNEFLF